MKSAAIWRRLRIATQYALLILFIALFVATEYRGRDEFVWPVALLFRIDPLAFVADLFAPGSSHLSILWPALLILIGTVVFGRFFCGWICPLGTTLDLCGRMAGRGRTPVRAGWRMVKYGLFFTLLFAALFGVQLFGLFDPLSIFLRTLTFVFYPAYNFAANAVFDLAWQHPIPVISPALNSLYPFWRDHFMAFRPPAYPLGLFTLAVFAGIVLLERIERRFWCKNICPLGGLFALVGRMPLLQRRSPGGCSACRDCAARCRLNQNEPVSSQDCLVCYDCAGLCPQEKTVFTFSLPKGPPTFDLSRRGLLAAAGGGILIAPAIRLTPDRRDLDPTLLRPPGARDEDEFLRRCIRCGECMKVCIGGALHPAFLQTGVDGLWTPLLLARIGFCEYNCTLCGQVCPTGAIRQLGLAEKQKTVIGLAVLDKNRCLPLARGEECLVCEEHCPTGKKAIVFDEREVSFGGEIRRLKQPRVIKDLCIGCGICETRCPLQGASAIRVTNENESRRQAKPFGEDGY